MKDLEDQKIHEAWFKMTPGKTTVNPTGTLKFQYNYSKNRVKFENFKADGLTPMDTAGLADPFLVINFGNKKEKTVTQKRTLSPQWPKSISFEIPADSKGTFYIEIYSDNRDGTSDFMGEVRLPVAEIKEGNDEVTMEVKKKEQLPTVGEMRVALHARKSVILKESDYTSLFELLMKDNMELTKKLVAVSNKKEKPIAECLVKAFEMRRLAVHFIKTITSIEIEKTSEPNIIFRENTVATKSLDMYMRLIGMQYLHSIMKNIVAQLVLNEKKKSCELDEFRIEDKQERKQKIIAKNLTTLMSFVSLIFEDMQKKIDYCPTNLRNIFEHIQGLIKQKWPDHPTAQYTAVSGFIFLRFFCPSLYSPKLYDLTTSHPPPNVARELTLIAKTLQNLASLVVFGKKEPFMHIVNPFITEQMPNMKTYLTELSSIPEKAVDELPTKTDIHWGREMSRVHFHLEDNLEAMKAQFGLTQDLEKLTEILKDLKKKEMEYKESRLKIPAPLHEVAPMAGDEEDSTFYKGSLSSDGPDFSASISTGPKNDKRGGLASSKTITNTNSTPKKPSSLMSSIDQKPERPSSPLQITEPCPGCSKRFSEAETSVLLELSTNTFWHTDCLKCSNCHKHITQYALKKPLLCLACAEVDSKCARCKEVFKAGESVLRVDLKAFHRHCLNCSLCAAPMDPKTANGYFSGVSTPDLLYICSSCTPEKEKDKGDWVFLSTKVT
uniref:Ras-GAP domain-containing protein n=1 Tax=Arcella intermedia TaxID=1963864 RepID=A0A6B2KXY0_9EUKA